MVVVEGQEGPVNGHVGHSSQIYACPKPWKLWNMIYKINLVVGM
jgi:hypothetical protein